MLRLFRLSISRVTILAMLAIAPTAFACSDDEDPTPTPTATATPAGPSEGLKREVIENYTEGVYTMYSLSLASAKTMDEAIDAFLAEPSEANLTAARQAWLDARVDYSPTEAFRFYGGPIDNDEDGVEGLVNAWPLDEGYIDYVVENPNAGIINMPDEYPVIDADLLVSLNEEGGEANISTGWHAIEFLLWGQDLSDDGPGDRPFTDYTTAENADRRGQYLAVASDLLITHLESVADAWAPDGSGNYRDEFLALSSDEALTNIFTGFGELSRGELAGERMTVAYEARSQEDEHSCFSDNTHKDIIGNAIGIQMVYTGDYGSVSGPGIHDLVNAVDIALADELKAQIEASVDLAIAIPAPFDQHLGEDVPNSDPGRVAVLDTIVALENQTDTIVDAAEAIGVTISVS